MKTSIDDRTEKSISLFLKLRRILNKSIENVKATLTE